MARPFNAPKALPTKEELLDMFDYSPDTGILTWRLRPPGFPRAAWWNSRFGGKPAGSTHSDQRYIRVMIQNAHHFAHRIIWKMVHGVDPGFIDHINGNPEDNRIVNLRDVSLDENLRNKSIYKNNTSGIPGVGFHGRDNVWVARVGVSGKQLRLGDFKTKEEAAAAIRAAHVILDYHGNHGRKPNPEN